MTKPNKKIVNNSNIDRFFAFIGLVIPLIQFLKIELEK